MNATVTTSYIKWIDTVQVRAAENQKVYVTQSAIRADLARIKEASSEVFCRGTSQYRTQKSIYPSALRLGEKVRLVRKKAHFVGGLRKVLGIESVKDAD